MSQEVVKLIIRKASSDSEFRQKLLDNPDTALKAYEGQLTPEELSAIKAMTAGVLEGVVSVVEEEKQAAAQPWYLPSSFKEFGSAVVSVILLLFLLYAVMQTYGRVGVAPQVVKLTEDTHQVVDTYDRAKDVLDVLFPLFGAVTSFWLGVAVEGRRADQSQEAAEQANEERAGAEEKTRETQTTAARVVGQTLGAAKVVAAGRKTRGIADPTRLADIFGVTREQAGEIADFLQPADTERAQIDKLVDILDEAEKAFTQ